MPLWGTILTLACSVLVTIVSITTLVWNLFNNYSKDIKDSIEKSENRINTKIDSLRKEFIQYTKRTDERIDHHLENHK